MRIIFILLLQCLFIGCFAQTGTIRVKKSNDCDFEFTADSTLLNKTFMVSKYAVVGVNGIALEKTVRNDFQNKSNLYDELVLVSKVNFEKELKGVCEMKDYKILSVSVGKSPTYSKDKMITIIFTLIKK